MPYLNIFSNCQIVTGVAMSLLCDLQIRKFYHISNDTAEVLQFLQKQSIQECLAYYGTANEEAIMGYINFIVEKELGFIDDHLLEELTPLDITWDRPSAITNVILEYHHDIDYSGAFFQELFDLNVQGLEIRFYTHCHLDRIIQLLELFNGTIVSYIKLILPFDAHLTLESLDKLVKSYPRVKSILFHSAPEDDQKKIFADSVRVIYFSQPITSCMACGEIRTNYFVTTMELFTESQQYNTCLNRKLSVDLSGNIKNCPSLPDSYGNVANTSLTDVLNNTAFQRYNKIRKDDISICKSCEFRHVCTDCRAYREDPQDLYAKPLKCGYDPYSNSWDDWTQNPLKKDAIVSYGLTDKLIQQAR